MEELCCPISGCIFYDPIIAEDGFTYERQCIEHMFNRTNRGHLITKFREDNIMKTRCIDYIKKNPKDSKRVYVVKSPSIKNEYKDPDFPILSILDSSVIKSLSCSSLKSIILHNNNLEVENSKGKRLIHYLCYIVKSEELLELAIQRGIATQEGNAAWKPIHLVCANWRSMTALSLLQNVDLNVATKDQNRYTPIQLVLRFWKDSQAIQYLVTRFINLHDLDGVSRNLLHYIALYMNNREGYKLMQFLIEKRVNVNVIDADNNKPIHIVFNSWKKSYGLNAIKLLLDNGTIL